jgi:outer membrane cobalamin receptor
MQPIAADDALRFLPGAVVNTAGQRGGISSLFVRGGESTYNKVIVDGVAIDNPGETFDFGTLPWRKPIAWNLCGARRALCTAPTP